MLSLLRRLSSGNIHACIPRKENTVQILSIVDVDYDLDAKSSITKIVKPKDQETFVEIIEDDNVFDLRSSIISHEEGAFSVLPDEMRLEIFSKWIDSHDWKSLAAASRVNKRWNREIRYLWRRFYETHTNVDGIEMSKDEELWRKRGKNWKWVAACLTRVFTAEETRNGIGCFATTDPVISKYEGHYEGHWKDNKRDGVGRLWWTNKDRFIGEWKADQKTGQGVMIWSNGDRYEGGWKEDLRHGPEAKYYYSNGGVYKGTYSKDERHGKGVFIWPDGDRYVGDWKNGGRYGKGTFITSDGTRYIQKWKEESGTNYSTGLPTKFPPEEQQQP